jgi:signal transduction histidine kinase
MSGGMATGDGVGEDGPQRESAVAAARSLLSELDLDTLLRQVLDAARSLTGARYAALGTLDEQRLEFETFVAVGVDEATREAIGDPPRGRGILGLLIEDARPLRLRDLADHPRSYGFPAGHPPMRTFLGVPILIDGRGWGNLYLCDKADDAAFDEADEEAVVVLAEWAAIAIQNASSVHRLRRRHDTLQRAVRNFEATTAIARAVGAETRIERVLELIVKRGRALVDARAMVILLRDGDDLTLAASAGEVDAAALGRRIAVEGSTAQAVLAAARPERIGDVASRLRIAPSRLGIRDAHTALLVPLEFRSRRLGVLAAFDRIGEEASFDRDQQALLLSFAASAATAVATAQSVERDRLRASMAAAERERQRWARELHDETLQGLAGFQLHLADALAHGDPAELRAAVERAVTQAGREIEQLRVLIAELRPAALDQRGLRPAIEDLAEQVTAREGIETRVHVELDAVADRPLSAELRTAVYRLVQEALTNVVKHARADRVSISVERGDGGLEVAVHDDGAGFDPGAPLDGYGLAGMRERVELCGGTLSITSEAGDGTTVRAWLGVGGAAAA